MTSPRAATEGAHADRPPGGRQKVVLLLPIWGAHYIERFSRIGLKTLLAAGNIPALADAFDCEFVFLTRAEDADFFDRMAPVRRLRELCDVSFRSIDDLIVDTTYAVTITTAFAEAVRARGEAMLETHFVFLVADYIMADGSLRSLIPHIRDGRSAIQAGNFQVVEEDFLPLLDDFADDATQSISILPRRLVRLALEHLHPISYANFFDQSVAHAIHCNRLFWRVDDNTMLGRFFLLHMLCIRPEITDFEIGASCDYAFVPEMCPSGDRYIVDDSDEYLVVEHQPLLHEVTYIKPGPMRFSDLVRLTVTWTTQEHRDNVHHSIVYHAAPRDEGRIARTDETAARYVDELMRRVSGRPPQPVRGHPYWLGAVDAFRMGLERRNTESTQAWLTNASWTRTYNKPSVRRLRRLFDAVFGVPPFVRPWHHNWVEYRHAVAMLRELLNGPQRRMMVVSEMVNPFSPWLLSHRDRTTGFQITRLLSGGLPSDTAPSSFDSCFVYLQGDEIERADRILEAVKPALAESAEILVYVNNNHASYLFSKFVESTLVNAPRFVRPGISAEAATYVYSLVKLMTQSALEFTDNLVRRRGWQALPVVASLLAVTYVLVLADNAMRALGLRAQVGYCTAAIYRLRRRAAGDAPGADDAAALKVEDSQP